MKPTRGCSALLLVALLATLLLPAGATARTPIALGVSISPEWGTSGDWWDTELGIVGASRGPAIMSMFFAWNGPFAEAPHQDILEDTVYQPTGYPKPATLDVAYARGAVPMLTWQPNLRDGETIASVLDGRYDAYIRSWALAAAADGRPVLIRFAQEMNGVSFPWAAARKGNDAPTFVKVWRKVVRAFRAAGADNVRWVWSPYVKGGPRAPFATVWPGARFVDYIGLDGYNWYTTGSPKGQWRSFRTLFRASLEEVHDRWPGKPVIIAEVGSIEPHPADPWSKGAWLRAALRYLAAEHPQVVGFVYFDIGLHGREHDVNWRLDTGPSSLAAWRWAVDDPRFRGRAGVLGIRLPR
ncbi:MAG: glycosyl hydrolase [Chloroflexota bacterium]